ncbi:hypothetical protein EDB82DRAFT_260659 [Fusarium venenatum]|uniref:uncharacterized protein n=1 Tax=Fusarium venenatum TaxID=56646 RepID=UPI001D41E480|nr:hypothetical protein EDB82DRAFT_260659 [Fusarium venenatum]
MTKRDQQSLDLVNPASTKYAFCIWDYPLLWHKIPGVSNQELAYAPGRIVCIVVNHSHRFQFLRPNREQLPASQETPKIFLGMHETDRQIASCDFSSVVLSQSNFCVGSNIIGPFTATSALPRVFRLKPSSGGGILVLGIIQVLSYHLLLMVSLL